MKRKTVLLLLVLGVAIGVLVAPGVALASWTDIGDSAWISQYGVTAAQVDTVADGYPDGTFKPSAQVTRGQFTKMAVNGLDVPVLSPLTPTFSDVPRTHIFYTHIEGANAAGLVNGVGGGLFTPSAPISRQQVATILARWLSEAELDALGYIAGPAGTQYPSLSAWYAAQGATALASFFDQASIATVHRPGVAYLAARGIAQGSSGYFTPMANITRAQAAVLVLRVLDESDDFTVLTPTVTDVNPDNGPATGGTTVVITGTNFTAGATVKFGAAIATAMEVDSATQITAISPVGTAGTTVQVAVTTGAGTSANTAADNFTYNDGPTVTINQAASQADPTHASPINFTVVFSETVTDFTTGDVTITGTAPGTLVGTVTGSGKTYNVAVSGMTGSGTVIASIAAGKAHNAASKPNVASTSTDHTVTYDGGPTVTINQASGQDDPTHTSPIDFTVVFSTTVTDFDDKADVTITGTAGGTKTVDITGSGKTYNVAVSGMTTDGTVIASIPAGVAKDASSNTNAASTSTDHTVTWTQTGPVITSLTDSAGGATENNTVTIKGTGFGNDEDEITVMFGAVEALVEDVNSSGTTLEVEAPDGVNHTVVDVRVITDEGTSPNTQADDYAYGEPVLTSLVPASGDTTGGNKTIITGTGFTADARVYFDGDQVSSSKVSVDSPTKITVVVPAGTGTDQVTVRNDQGLSNELDYDYDADAPYITSLSKNAGVAAGGNTITINGGNFITAGLEVWFGSEQVPSGDLTRNSSTKLTVEVPGGTAGTTVDVQVITDDGTSPDTPADDYAYGKPTITGLDPDVGDPLGGTVVIIQGTGFTLDSTVTFGGVSAEVVSVNAANTQLTVIAPEGDDGDTVSVRVTSDAGYNTNTSDDDFTYDADYLRPTVSAVNPDEGSMAGGTAVTITGTNFVDGATVKFGTKSATDVVVVDENTITCTSPSYASATTIQVKVTTVYGYSLNTSDDNFTYTAGPTVTINEADAQADPTAGSPINFTVVFSESVADFATGDVTLTGTANATTATVTPAGPGTTYNVAVSGMTGDGTVIASIAAGVAHNAATDPNEASTSDDHTVTYDATDPTTASVTTPVDTTIYNATTMPVTFQGSGADNANGSGLAANSTVFFLQRSSDSWYWNGSAWQALSFELPTTHSVTTGSTSATWTDNVTLPAWSDVDTYTVWARATDKVGNEFDGTAITFNYDSSAPATASVTTPVDTTSYDAAGMPVTFQGSAADNAGGSGLNADTTTFTLQRNSDNYYWNGSTWQVAVFRLATTHIATTGGTSVTWTDSVTLPGWDEDETYTVQARATDKGGNILVGTAITFTYDNL